MVLRVLDDGVGRVPNVVGVLLAIRNLLAGLGINPVDRIAVYLAAVGPVDDPVAADSADGFDFLAPKSDDPVIAFLSIENKALVRVGARLAAIIKKRLSGIFGLRMPADENIVALAPVRSTPPVVDEDIVGILTIENFVETIVSPNTFMGEDRFFLEERLGKVHRAASSEKRAVHPEQAFAAEDLIRYVIKSVRNEIDDRVGEVDNCFTDWGEQARKSFRGRIRQGGEVVIEKIADQLPEPFGRFRDSNRRRDGKSTPTGHPCQRAGDQTAKLAGDRPHHFGNECLIRCDRFGRVVCRRFLSLRRACRRDRNRCNSSRRPQPLDVCCNGGTNDLRN
ncbi:hypothetical protein QA649_28870 [Bradyrhizobium sp. CB1717]|uniref:hypothetical protein n=1 Tax=Bradyrhizobium sp. CB1717 TaxID=3039154 RepID=UPI0024B26202|nr:hypothetical protein [Bradyrhizobium sp. CB1717]WFU22089.1 hypothetical protein QA649_28870 [Bradyrhizobium sp. CB1717]